MNDSKTRESSMRKHNAQLWVLKMIFSDNDGFIYFNELLYKTMKRRYANGRTKKKVMYELELDTLEKLEKIMK